MALVAANFPHSAAAVIPRLSSPGPAFTAPAVPVVGWGRLPCSPQGDHHHPHLLCELRSSLAFSGTTPGLGLDVSYQLEEVLFEKL